ncbi:MAG: hypothetical protein KGO49_10000 [Gammaproteobacteria bacterium]|nr:hypothetical protein [Gammaproteobacteria bacterium]
MSVKRPLTIIMSCTTTLLLAGCGGGTTDQVLNSVTPPALADGPGGNFYGYYIQSDNVVDPATNIGGLYLSLPNSEASFTGRMSYQFFDCQRTNALNISGQKTTAYLNGTSIGTLDSATVDQPNPTFSATFSGSYSRTGDNYTGKYNRIDKNGDDIKTVAGCGTYTVADKGTWQVYKEAFVFPANFTITQTGDLLNWSFVNGAQKALIMILDPAKISSGNNAVIRQIVTTAAPNTINVVNNNVTRGQPYRAVVELFDSSNSPVAFETLAVSF